MATRTETPNPLGVRALVLGAGRGKRMRPLTDTCPKPLLKAGGRSMAERQVAALARAGVTRVVINTAHLADAFPKALGDGASLGVSLAYSREGNTAEEALETLGGVVRALPLLTDGATPFLVVAGDIVTDYDYAALVGMAPDVLEGRFDAHLVLVPNPAYHPSGDMDIDSEGFVRREPRRWTYGCLGIFSPRIFSGLPATRAKLFPWLFGFADRGRVRGSVYRGRWFNIGTPEDLAAFVDWEPS